MGQGHKENHFLDFLNNFFRTSEVLLQFLLLAKTGQKQAKVASILCSAENIEITHPGNELHLCSDSMFEVRS